MFSQDKDLRFTWAHNAPAGLSLDQLEGKTDADVMPPEAAETVMAAKRKAMDTGEVATARDQFRVVRPEAFLLSLDRAAP